MKSFQCSADKNLEFDERRDEETWKRASYDLVKQQEV